MNHARSIVLLAAALVAGAPEPARSQTLGEPEVFAAPGG